MPQVKMPNGDVVAFPDDMPREQIKGMIATKFPQLAPQSNTSGLESSIAGAGQGYSAGLGDEALAGLAAPVEWAGGRLAGAMGAKFKPEADLSKMSLGEIYRMERDKTRGQLKEAEEANPKSYLGGQVMGAVASPAKFKGGLVKQGAKYGALSAFGESEADSAGGLAADTAMGGGAGALTGGLMAGVGKAIKPVADKAVSGTRKAASEALKKIGIDDLTPGQLTGSKSLQTVESVMDDMLTTSGSARVKKEGQLTKFTKAALEKAGIKGDRLTAEVREQAESNFGDAYQKMFAGKKVGIDKEGMTALRNIQLKEASKLPTTVKPIVQSYFKDIMGAKGKMDGEAYQRLRSQLTKQSKSLSATDPFTADVLRNIRNVLDTAAEKSIPEAQQGALRTLNNQYRNYKSLVKSVSNASEDAVEGVVSPTKLLQVLESGNKTKTQAGYGDLYELANAGRLVLPSSVPNSGTAQRQLAQRILTSGGTGAAVGGATYGVTGDPEKAVLAAGASLAGPKLAQKALNSKAAQSYFTKGIPGLSSIPDGVGGALSRGLAIGAGSGAAGTMNDRREPVQQDAPPQPQSSNFDNAVNFVFAQEGGYVADDAGKGETNMGINISANPDLDVKNLTPEQAKETYKKRYWKAVGADMMPPQLALVAFDSAVNQGVSKAKSLVKKSGGDPMKLLALRKQHYDSLVKLNPKKYGKYHAGWMQRLNELQQQIMEA